VTVTAVIPAKAAVATDGAEAGVAEGVRLNSKAAGGGIGVMLVVIIAVVRMGFRLLLEGSADIKVVPKRKAARTRVASFPKSGLNVVVMDISMPGIGGLRPLTDTGRVSRGAHSCVVRTRGCDACAPRSESRRCRYLTKRSAAEALMQAIRQGAQGKTFLERQLPSRWRYNRSTASAILSTC